MLPGAQGFASGLVLNPWSIKARLPLFSFNTQPEQLGGTLFNVASMVGGVESVARDLTRFSSVLSHEAVGQDTANIVSKHPLEGWTPKQVVEYTDHLGLKTPRDQLILWSGLGRGETGKILSQEYATANGGVTLELTAGGKWLDELDLFSSSSPFTREETLQIWSDVSSRMIQQASGQVRSLIGTIRPKSIYRTEQSELLMNKNILGLDEFNLKPKYYFGKY